MIKLAALAIILSLAVSCGPSHRTSSAPPPLDEATRQFERSVAASSLDASLLESSGKLLEFLRNDQPNQVLRTLEELRTANGFPEALAQPLDDLYLSVVFHLQQNPSTDPPSLPTTYDRMMDRR